MLHMPKLDVSQHASASWGSRFGPMAAANMHILSFEDLPGWFEALSRGAPVAGAAVVYQAGAILIQLALCC